MTKTTSWIVAVASLAVAAGVGLLLMTAFVISGAYGDVVSDRTCIAALDAQAAAPTNGPHLKTLQILVDKYCNEVAPAEE